MSPLSIFGLFAVSCMLVFYAYEDRGSLFILLFAFSCALGSIYGFLQGAWPFGINLGRSRGAPLEGRAMGRRTAGTRNLPALRSLSKRPHGLLGRIFRATARRLWKVIASAPRKIGARA